MPGTFCWKNEKSSAVPVSGPSMTFSAPAARRSVGSMRSVSAGSLRVTGYPSVKVSVAVAPALSAMFVAIAPTRR